MPRLNVLAVLAIGATLGSAVVGAEDTVDESRQAIRCATVYKLMAEMPDLPEADKRNLTGLMSLMIDLYMRGNPDTTNAARWSGEFNEELTKYSDGTDPELISREMVVCDALLKQESATDPNLVPSPPDETK